VLGTRGEMPGRPLASVLEEVLRLPVYGNRRSDQRPVSRQYIARQSSDNVQSFIFLFDLPT
jgi:hypothetical protein